MMETLDLSVSTINIFVFRSKRVPDIKFFPVSFQIFKEFNPMDILANEFISREKS